MRVEDAVAAVIENAPCSNLSELEFRKEEDPPSFTDDEMEA